jgi:hypothetical protein
MSEPACRTEELEESFDTSHRRPGEARRTRSLRLPWRGLQLSVFWSFGIKVKRPKRTVPAPRPMPVPRVELKA